jgi:aryl-alcohol dehydrogenase-like predicted oxidoreductase
MTANKLGRSQSDSCVEWPILGRILTRAVNLQMAVVSRFALYPGTSTVKHLGENIAAAAIELDAGEWLALETAASRASSKTA